MNNKDLFNAINDIDEKFIEDAGKYLSDDDSDDPSHSEAIEIFPGETRFSPIKLVASLVAAAVLITGVTVAVRHHRRSLSISPNTVDAASGGNATGTTIGQGNGETDSAAVSTHVITTAGPLPFEIIGPDDRQLWYEDITDIEKFVAGVRTYEPLLKEDLTEDNWLNVTCGNFAYIAVPNGNNFNTVDNSPADMNIKNGNSLEHEFRRVYAGSTFGGLTVTKASSTFTRLANRDEETEDGKVKRVTALSHNYVEFDGSITADVYLVNDDGDYYCVFRNGENKLPLIGYDIYNFLTLGEHTTEINTINFNDSFQYAGELPALTLDEKEKESIEPYLCNANYLKAQVILENIKVEGNQHLGSNSYTYTADLPKIVFSFVETVVTDSHPFGETPFTGETEMKLRAILGSAGDIPAMKNDVEALKITDCTDIRVFRDMDKNGDFVDEILEGNLASGNIIALYTDDIIIAAYVYHPGIGIFP